MTEPIQNRSDKQYLKNLWGIASIILGAFLLIEHIFVWGEFTFFDFFGHEWLGLFLVILGCVINAGFWRNK